MGAEITYVDSDATSFVHCQVTCCRRTHCIRGKGKNDKVASGNDPAAACSYKGKVRKFAIRFMVNSSRY
jgi:hypothetical protein